MKLSPAAFYTIGLSVAAIAIGYGLFQEYIPNSDETKMYDDTTQQLQSVAAQMPQAKKRVENARRDVLAKDAAWKGYVQNRTPSSRVENGGIDISVNPYQLALDTPKFRNNVQRAVNAMLRKGGVKVISGPYVPGLQDANSVGGILASYYNYPAFPFPVVIYDLGTVTVQGTYKQITENVRNWSRMPRYLAIADGLRITGTSPRLTGTYNLSLVGFIRGNKLFGPIPESGTVAAGTPAGPGGPGGFGVGFGGPGGRPGGPGGPPGGPSMPGRPGGPGMAGMAPAPGSGGGR